MQVSWPGSKSDPENGTGSDQKTGWRVLVRYVPEISRRRRQLDQERVQKRYRQDRQHGSGYDVCWKLVEVVPHLYLTAALLCHLTAFAVHLLAAVLLHPTHLWSDSAGKGRNHHDEHDENSHNAGASSHVLTIFLRLQHSQTSPLLASPASFRTMGSRISAAAESAHARWKKKLTKRPARAIHDI